jgi:hypothetical protein
MQDIKNFNSNLGTAIGLVGPAGSGKTVLGMRLFPKTYVLVGDLNFQSGKRYLEKIGGLGDVVGFDTIDVDEIGKKVLPLNRYDRFWKCLNSAASDPKVDAIFVDGATQITQYIIAKVVNAQTEEQIQIVGGKDSWPKWGTVGVTWRGLIAQIRTTGKKFILAIHEQKNQDESDSIWKHELLIPGQTKDMLPNLMSDVWRTEVKEEGGKHVWMVRTLPNIRMEFLKNTYGLPAVLPADDLVKKVREQK